MIPRIPVLRTNRLLGLALALVCCSWVFLLPIYLPPGSFLIPWLLLGLALLLLFWRTGTEASAWISFLSDPQWVAWLGAVACGGATLFFPYPYNIGFAPLGFGWMALNLPVRQRYWRRVAVSLVQIGLLVSVSAALLPVLFAWAARVHDLGQISQLVAGGVGGVLRLLGPSVEFLPHGTLFLRTFEDAFPFTVTGEKLLPVPLALFALIWSGILLGQGRRKRFKKVAFFWLGLALFLVLRVALLILLMLQRDNPSWFWDPWALGVSVVVLALFTINSDMRPLKTRVNSSPNKEKAGQTRMSDLPKKHGGEQTTQGGLRPFLSVTGLITGSVIGLGMVGYFTFRDPGTAKAGRVMINEHGSDWEWTTDTLTTESYNEKTTYNYYCLAEYLKYYYEVRINQEPLSLQALQNVDVLILKMPTQPYTAAEVDAVVDYVKGGGSLWVIGDHTNVFGSSSFLNPLLRRFDFSLKYTSTHDLASGNLSLYEKPGRFAHSSVIGLPPYLFATSCSMQAPWSAESTILGYGLRADRLDYSQKNFFADRSRQQFNLQFGLFLQQAARRFGKGRLLIYTDSTTFSNFFVFLKGKPELVLGSLDWLNRKPRLVWVNTALLLLTLLALLTLVWRRYWNGAVLAGVILGATLMGFATDTLAKRAHPLPHPVRSVPWVNFEREHSSYFLPRLRLANDKDADYLTFYVWTQRVGAVPREVDRFSEAISGTTPVVIINPAKPFTLSEKSTLQRYLERGGRLLLLTSTDQIATAAQDLLQAYEIQIHLTPAAQESQQSLTLGGRSFPLVVNRQFSSLEGGEAILQSDQGETIGVAKTVGQGKLWVLSCGHLFRNNYMGQTSTVPDAGMRELYEVEFRLIRELLGGGGVSPVRE